MGYQILLLLFFFVKGILLLFKTVMTQANEDKSHLNSIMSELGWHQFMLIQLFSHLFIKINNAATYSFVYKLFLEISSKLHSFLWRNASIYFSTYYYNLCFLFYFLRRIANNFM